MQIINTATEEKFESLATCMLDMGKEVEELSAQTSSLELKVGSMEEFRWRATPVLAEADKTPLALEDLENCNRRGNLRLLGAHPPPS